MSDTEIRELELKILGGDESAWEALDAALVRAGLPPRRVWYREAQGDRMGYQDYLKKEDCHDCGAKPGEFHDPGCDTEQCPLCGFQVISCEHGEDVFRKTGRWFKERLPWTGIWSMTEEAVEYGFFVRWEGPLPGGSWVPCAKDHPGVMRAATTLRSIAGGTGRGRGS
jgi:hypothetical protein